MPPKNDTTRRSTPPEGFERELGPGGLEGRTVAGKERLETRAAGDGAKSITGYGSVTNQRTTISGWFDEWDEEVAEGAWTKTIAEADIRSMFNHNTERLLGRTKSNTLRLSEDPTGLLYDVDINPDDPNALSVYAQVERGDVDGSSVWFRVIRQEWLMPTEDNGLERELRRILEAELIETGPVVFPAFVQTTATARNLGVVDVALRAAGFDASKRARTAFDLLSDPSSLEGELRSLFASAPELRDAVCACETTAGDPATAPHRAAPVAPGEGNDTPAAGPPVEFFTRRAAATASRFGLTLTKELLP